ncbi:serine/threonine-protein kinase pim-1-like isoform X1 [Gouania willdenowi]|uniref:serine/threonine-protein kinase pim-1-like isoform X1 n=1 Tax=Gouania willdenowi TaxID=441366 RepID=UPI0010543B64|nr:serine/threonine-protein kinase pim-1-like isoform X1 [Gouania willdenowi]
MKFDQEQIIKSVQALISEKYKDAPIIQPSSCYTAVVVEVVLREAWTSGGSLMNQECSEDQPLEHLHLQQNHSHYFIVKVPDSGAPKMVEVETENEEGLQTRRGCKRKAGDHNVQTPNKKKVKVEEGLQTRRGCKRKAGDHNVQTPNKKKVKVEEGLQTRRGCKRKAGDHAGKPNKKKVKVEEGLQTRRCCKGKAGDHNVGKPKRKKVKVEEGLQTRRCCKGKAGDHNVGKPKRKKVKVEEGLQTRETFIRNKEYFEATYKELKVLGHGGFGRVLKAVRLSDSKPVAIKHIPRDMVTYVLMNRHNQRTLEVSEVVMMKRAASGNCQNSLLNPAIIGFEELIELDDELLIVMEHVEDAVDLQDFVTSSTEPMLEHDAKSIIKQVLDAAVIMQHNNVFHSDIKRDNILVSFKDERPSVKIIDFGCANFIFATPYESFSGTEVFAPPEVWFHRVYEAEPTTVWQIGLLLSNLFRAHFYQTYDHVINSTFTLNNLSHQGNDFMSRCMKVSPKLRPSLKDLQLHPWFNDLTPP